MAQYSFGGKTAMLGGELGGGPRHPALADAFQYGAIRIDAGEDYIAAAGAAQGVRCAHDLVAEGAPDAAQVRVRH